MDDSDLPHRPARRMMPVIVLAATVVIVGAVAVVALQFGGGHGTFPVAVSPTSTPTSTSTSTPMSMPIRYGYACVDLDPQTCSRQARDYGLRGQLTPVQQKETEAAADDVDRVLESASDDDRSPAPESCEPNGGSCSMAEQPPTEAQVQLLRTALAKAGITNAVVKIAGRGDLEPAGTIEYAVPAGPGCDIGFLRGLRWGGSHTVSGRYPDGDCLHQK